MYANFKVFYIKAITVLFWFQFDLKKIGVGNKTFWLTLYMNYGISRKVSIYWLVP